MPVVPEVFCLVTPHVSRVCVCVCVFRSCRCVLRRRTLWITWLVCCRIPSWRYGWHYAAIFPEPRSSWHTSSTRSSHRAATRRRPKSLHQLPRYPKTRTDLQTEWHKHNTERLLSSLNPLSKRSGCLAYGRHHPQVPGGAGSGQPGVSAAAVFRGSAGPRAAE